MQTETTRPVSLLPLVLAFLFCITVFHLGNAVVGRSFIRASHLGTALEYASGPINLLRPVIVGFDAKGTPAALEFPLWQAATGLLFKLTNSTWYGWANLMSLALFVTALWPFLQLGRHYVGERAAWWATAFFLTQPLIVIMSGEAATDGFSLAVTLWFLYFAHRMISTGLARWWLPTAIFAAISAVSKLPFFMAAGLCSFFMLLERRTRVRSEADTNATDVMMSRGQSVRLWLLLAGTGAVAAACLAAWTLHANSLAAQAEFPFLDLRLSHSPFLRFWFFGDLHYRFSPGAWIKGAWRFLHATLGALPMVGFFLPSLLTRGNRFPKLWLLATFLTTLVFTHLVLAHWHYYLMCCPAVALLCGATVARLEPSWARAMPSSWLRLTLAAAVMGFSTIDGLIAMKIAIDYDYFPKAISALIRQQTKPDDKLVLYTCDPDWGGEPLFRSGRKGLSVIGFESSPATPTVKGLQDLLTNNSDLRRLKELGYTKLVMVSESPVRFAVEASNPGSKRKRRFYPQTISETVDAWPAIYRSDDLLIKQIP